MKRGTGRGVKRVWAWRRAEKDCFNNIVRKLAIEDTPSYKEIMRISYTEFLQLLKFIEEYITPKQIIDENLAISPKERLVLILQLFGNWGNLQIAFFPIPNFESCYFIHLSSGEGGGGCSKSYCQV